MTKIESYLKRLLPLVSEQYRGKERFLSILVGMGLNADDLEEALFELQDGFRLQSAMGAQLDMIGAIFGEKRGLRGDQQYRVAIIDKASSKLSGTPEEIMQALRVFYGATYAEYVQDALGSFVVTTDATVKDKSFQQIVPAGVAGSLVTPDRFYLYTISPREPLGLLDGGHLYLIEEKET